ncbi:MAG: C40 family peptidase [Alphaproteobacteria bacterium]|nr:C40 family peptidase [Alphaproteobacteria bacterium]MBU1526910.1 C40 family peptidase [Alphaproteobacteria bacterium]MBU2351828.1 C40 family peptidase [Alphaproteobacteria bacterium]MBU2383762.1 C40 family peptidase [Alphaproteobacteria bacterium]
MRGAVAVADVLDDDHTLIDQLLFGEAFDVLLREGGRVWGQCRRDGVVGWIDAGALGPGAGAPTHRVSSIGGRLPLNALVDVSGDPVGEVALTPIGEFEPDLASVAERLLGLPHRLGGRSDGGMDCAGLVQACLIACGRAAPRYADGQAEAGRQVDRSELRRGDLVVWPHAEGGPGWSGHAAIMRDGEALIHASGRAGVVGVESLATVDARQRAEGFGPPVFRRI